MRNIFLILLLIPLSATAVTNWQLQEEFTTTTSINDIQFVTPTVGWVRAGNLLYSTNNGGNYWKLIPLVLDTFKISNFEIRFFSKNFGWLMLERGKYLFKSVDGGDTWNRCRIPDMYVKDIYFSDSLKGWTCGINFVNNYTHEIVLHTIDGGVTWETLFTGNDNSTFERILFSDSLSGWVAGSGSYCNFSENCQSAGLVYRTNDGGITWERVFSGENLSAELSSLELTDSHHVFAFGSDVFDVDYIYSEPTLVFTNNRDSTWKNHVIFPHSTQSTFDNYECNGIHFIDSLNGYLIASRNDSSALMTTGDGGISWQSKVQFTGTLTAFEMLDTTHAWIGTKKGLLYVLSTPVSAIKHSSLYSRQPNLATTPQASSYGYLLNGRHAPIGSISSQWQCGFINNSNSKSSSHISLHHRYHLR
jgi:photosystem II stability/assembly factor-like uncharacterized protein